MSEPVPFPREFELIRWLRARGAGPESSRLKTGVGDDCAVFDFPQPSEALLTVDMLTEGVDFLLNEASPEQIGRKALAVSLSDIAAMAGRPLAALVAVALPKQGGFELAQRLAAGWLPLAREFDTAIIGGDTNSWNGPLVISTMVLGETTGSRAVLRSGARPGDAIFVTGSFGGSRLRKQFEFVPRVQEAQRLHREVELHALIDVSDGLVADLGHILDESQVGAIVEAQAIPLSPDIAAAATTGARTPLECALGDGEDFELIFTVSPDDALRLQSVALFETPLTKIGEITADPSRQLRLPDGRLTPLRVSGWEHSFS